MKLRSLTTAPSLAGVRVFVRVDWNIPLHGAIESETSLKIERSFETIEWLQKKRAIVIILTHLGRPQGVEPRFSTEPLIALLKKTYKRELVFHPQLVGDAKERKQLLTELMGAEPGSLHLLQNVRFDPGEEKNAVSLAKAYASLGTVFINDAFASCHRAHVSVVGLAKQLPAYAGFALQAEVQALSRLIQKPKKPFIAFVGGAKLSTKIPVLKALLAQCDRVYLGGAMATTLRAAQGVQVGKSLVEPAAFSVAKQLLKEKHLELPVDIMVTKKLENRLSVRVATFETIAPDELIVDIGPRTCALWGQAINASQTILWNGPMGIVEYRTAARGSRFLARAIGLRAKGKAFGVAGGGDTIPVILETKTLRGFDYVSTGGGALLEFVCHDGVLPGLKPLLL